MTTSDSKPKRTPLIVHFREDDRQRLRAVAENTQRSMSNLAAEFIRDGIARLEQQDKQAA